MAQQHGTTTEVEQLYALWVVRGARVDALASAKRQDYPLLGTDWTLADHFQYSLENAEYAMAMQRMVTARQAYQAALVAETRARVIGGRS